MLATFFSILAQAHEEVEETNDAADLYPHWEELVVGALAFGILFFFMWKWVIPRVNLLLEQRREKIQSDLEKAEEARRAAEAELADYRAQLASAREEANSIIEEGRRRADQLRAELQAKAEQESQALVGRAQEEIRAERDRVFQELRAQVAQLAVELAGRVVGESLDAKAHQRIIDEYIDQVSGDGKN
ncbi:MAG: F0F1 ATP synthase subunit B [Actinomycetota bacterium]